jgi:hypothetical protein
MHQQYFLMLGHAPAYFWVDFFVRESMRFMVEQNLILFYPWCYYATQKPSGIVSNSSENLTDCKRDLIIFSEY